ncbi:MAG: DUF6368 family protein [Myxococcales bacterium]
MGPIASVLFERPLSSEELVRLEADVGDISSAVRGRDFWVTDTRPIGGSFLAGDGGQPFTWTHGFEPYLLPTELAEQLAEVERGFGFRPSDELTFSAACNAEQDHRILAELCCAVAERWDGVVDLGGDPGARRHAESLLQGPGVFASESRSSSGDSCRHVYLSPGALRQWLLHPSFRMVK